MLLIVIDNINNERLKNESIFYIILQVNNINCEILCRTSLGNAFSNSS